MTDLQNGVMPTVPYTLLTSVRCRFYIMLYIVYHITIIYIYFVTGGATGCHLDNFSLYHFDGGSFRFSRVYIYVYMNV